MSPYAPDYAYGREFEQIPPEELVDLIADAMIKFGPDGHCDGAHIIAAIVWEWVTQRAKDKAA